jgi:transposase
MKAVAATPCADCAELRRRVDELERAVASQAGQLRDALAALAAAGKDSSTSSKPPSSDIVKPPKPAPPPGAGKRSRGGQPGHPGHARAAFPPEQVNGGFFDHRAAACPDCGRAVEPVGGAPRVVQRVDVPAAPPVVEEHRGHPSWCPSCLKVHYAPLPEEVERGGLLGPRLTTLVAYLKGVCHASFSTVRTFLRDVAGVTVSRGLLAKVVAKVADALDGPYEELRLLLPGEAVLNVDETGHKDGGEAMWAWCFRAELYTLFRIDPRRSADVLTDVLGAEFDGVLGCDHFSAYRRYMRLSGAAVQFCLAHLIRDVKFLTTLPDFEDVLYGERLRAALKGLFGVIHRRDSMAQGDFAAALLAARAEVLRVGTEMAPATRHGETMAKRLGKYGESYFTFVTTPGADPTNNAAEQAIRFVVIDRLVTQGTRGEAGRRWCERIWTVVATCARRGRSAYDFLEKAVAARLGGTEPPSLLAASA